MTPALEVVRVGVRTLIEDLGRPGQARLGVTASGAWDRAALTLANRLLGNAEGAAGLEVLLGGLALRALRDVEVAVTGAVGHLAIDGRPAPSFTPVTVGVGSVVAVGRPSLGLRSYVAVRGGLDGERVFGSRSGDPTTGIGPPPLVVGDLLSLAGDAEGPLRFADVAPAAGGTFAEVRLRVVLGPREDWFTDEAHDLLVGTPWQVGAEADRVGTRLLGPSLPRARGGELPSEGIVRGAVQVPRSGQPLVFGPDHPTTGGYPVIACAVGQDADALAQAAPGTIVRFEIVGRPW